MSDLYTMTVVKTDIRGFSARSARVSSDDLSRLLDDHRRLKAGTAKRFGGSVFKEMGDSVLIAFKSATGAVQAALEIQRGLSAAQTCLGDDELIEIRATVATGDVVHERGDYFGEPVILAA